MSLKIIIKQLKDKEQECEELKSDLTELSKIIDCKNGTILTFKQQLDQLKAENDDLKKTILQECPQCGEEYLTPKGAELYDENEKLKQVLQEIKEICKIAPKETTCDRCHTFGFPPEHELIKLILQKCEVIKDE